MNRQLEAKHIFIIDATPVEATQSGAGTGVDGTPKRDPDTGWHVKNNNRGKKAFTYGFSIYTGVDEDEFIRNHTLFLRCCRHEYSYNDKGTCH